MRDETKHEWNQKSNDNDDSLPKGVTINKGRKRPTKMSSQSDEDNSKQIAKMTSHRKGIHINSKIECFTKLIERDNDSRKIIHIYKERIASNACDDASTSDMVNNDRSIPQNIHVYKVTICSFLFLSTFRCMLALYYFQTTTSPN